MRDNPAQVLSTNLRTMSDNCNGHSPDDRHSHLQLHGDSASLGSPSHMGGLHPTLSPEDIQELLGGVLEDHPPHHGTGSATDPEFPSDNKAVARSERKRSREKQRRSDVNKQFSTLTDLLRQIETSHTDLFTTPIWTETSFSPTNRVELMARTIHVLQTMHDSHKRQKTMTLKLEEELAAAKKAGEEAAAKAKEKMMTPMQAGQNQVVMMVPMLLGGQAGAAGTAAPTAAVQTPMGFMPMPQAAEGGAAGMPGMPGMPWMMPSMSPWGSMMMSSAVATPTVAAPTTSPATSAPDETKQPTSAETSTSNLAHCA